MITASLGAYAVRSIVALGYVADQAIDGALLSIGYTRSASANFIALEGAVARYRTQPNQPELGPRINDISKMLDEDLAAVTQHALTPEAAQAAVDARAAVAEWRAAGNLAVAGAAEGSGMDSLARIASRRLERLVNHAAGDGLQFQELARTKVADAKFEMLLLTCAALILGGIIAALLARRIMGLIAAVSAAACRIAAGHVDPDLMNGGAKELGALLMTVGTMRANIVAMTALESAGRQLGKPTLAGTGMRPDGDATGRKPVEMASAASAKDGVKIAL